MQHQYDFPYFKKKSDIIAYLIQITSHLID